MMNESRQPLALLTPGAAAGGERTTFWASVLRARLLHTGASREIFCHHSTSIQQATLGCCTASLYLRRRKIQALQQTATPWSRQDDATRLPLPKSWHPGLNWGSFDYKSNALPLRHTSHYPWQCECCYIYHGLHQLDAPTTTSLGSRWSTCRLESTFLCIASTGVQHGSYSTSKFLPVSGIGRECNQTVPFSLTSLRSFDKFRSSP